MATKESTKNDNTKTPAKANLIEPSAEVAEANAALAKKKAKKAKELKARKTSALDAALRVLQEAGQPMTCPEMIERMAAKGYGASPKGATPAATIYSVILLEKTPRGRRPDS